MRIIFGARRARTNCFTCSIKPVYARQFKSFLRTTNRLKTHDPRSKHIKLDYDLEWGSLLSTTSYMQRHETTPDDEAEALEYCARAAFTRNNWEGDLFVDNVCERRADLSKFISDICDAPNRTRMLTNRPRTIRISLQRSF